VIRFFTVVLSLAIACFSVGECQAHGARCEAVEGAAAVRAYYDNGSPMAFCDVEIFRPGEDSEAFQVGTTDCNGTFGFVPDTTGTWRAVVDDGMGHMAMARIDAGPTGIRGEAAGAGPGVRGVIVGVSMIFGLFGLVALLYCRRKGHGQPCT
jgi:hypothetical protein